MKKAILLLSAIALCSCGASSSSAQSQQPVQGANIVVVTDDKEMGKTYVVPEEAKGAPVSNTQAMTIVRNIVAKHQAEDPETLASKYTIKMREVSNLGYMVHNYAYSKADQYLHLDGSMLYYPYESRNLPAYSWDDVHYYVKDGEFIQANSNSWDGYVEKEQYGEETRATSYVRESGSSKFYTVDEPEAFESNISTQLSNVISSLLLTEKTLAEQLESYGSINEVYEDMGMGGIVSVQATSKGEGNLYMCYSMPMMGIYMEILFEDYWLSYSYMDVDSTSMLSQLGMEDLGVGRMITESHYEIGHCEVTYPDLSSYERYGY